MLAEDVTSDFFIKRLRSKNNENICKAIMDQSIVAGVGNYLKADSLWAAEINPFAKVSDLNDNDLTLFCNKIKELIRISYKQGGATVDGYLDVDDKKDEYTSRFLVYNRQYDLMGNDVIKEITPDGRKTHWSPTVQTRGKK
jgi:formamidopyrimidine-DNA glycosylase